MAFALFAFGASAGAASSDWIEVKSPHFVVMSDAGRSEAREVAGEFEQIRAMFERIWKWARVDPGKPIVILAAKDEGSLKALLPGFWEKKGGVHPVGLFLRGTERNYVLLRTDLRNPRADANPYQILFHEYVHLILDLNFRDLPPWFNEGMAEFYGNTVIRDDAVLQGMPIVGHIYTLRDRKQLPIPTLFEVSHDSPEYQEDNKATIFYAQSWALVHYLILGDKAAHSAQLNEFATRLRRGEDGAKVAQETFGDLAALGKALDQYVRRYAYTYRKLGLAVEAAVPDAAPRAVPAAESLAVRGDFLLDTGRKAEARALLDQALAADPKLAPAHLSLGRLYLIEDRGEEGRREIARAVELGSDSYLAHYLHARTFVHDGATPEDLAQAEASLGRAVQLNDRFAPAYLQLAWVRDRRGAPIDETIGLAGRALNLDPWAAGNHLYFGRLLRRAGRRDEARVEAQRTLALARGEGETKDAREFLDELARPEPTPAPSAAAVVEDGAGRMARFEKACADGDLSRCGAVAWAYENGQDGLAKNVAKAMALYEKTCSGGITPACVRLAFLHLGRGTTRGQIRAAKLLQQACDAGDAMGCTDLGDLVRSGVGIARDPVRARILYEKACAAGYGPACAKAKKP